jgi:hypothetical protein
MRTTALLSLGVGLAAIFAVSCVFPIMIPEDAWWGRSGASFRRVVPLEEGGSLLLENDTGDVEIRGWDRAEVEITAEEGWGRLARPGFDRIGWGWGRASSLDVAVDKIENLLKITTRSSGRADIVHPVHYALNVPRSITIQNIAMKNGNLSLADLFGEVKADVLEGDVRIFNYSGSLDLLAGRGDVEVELLDIRAEDDVMLTAKDGNLTVYLQPEASARIEATASNGAITSEFDLGQTLPAKKVSGSVGKPDGGVLSLTAFRGDIRLMKTR